jgi:hypothetical protein
MRSHRASVTPCPGAGGGTRAGAPARSAGCSWPVRSPTALWLSTGDRLAPTTTNEAARNFRRCSRWAWTRTGDRPGEGATLAAR